MTSLSFQIFDILDQIKASRGVSDGEWSTASKIGQPRISELRARKRRFTIQRCAELINGLKAIIGDDLVNEDLARLLEKAKNKSERLILLALAIPQEKQDQAERELTALIEE